MYMFPDTHFSLPESNQSCSSWIKYSSLFSSPFCAAWRTPTRSTTSRTSASSCCWRCHESSRSLSSCPRPPADSASGSVKRFIDKQLAYVQISLCDHRRRIGVIAITKNVISDQDHVQAIYFDLRSDQWQTIFVILRPRGIPRKRQWSSL